MSLPRYLQACGRAILLTKPVTARKATVEQQRKALAAGYKLDADEAVAINRDDPTRPDWVGYNRHHNGT